MSDADVCDALEPVTQDEIKQARIEECEKTMNRFCKVCGKKLVHGQTKFCCREHWLLFEKKKINTCSVSRNKNNHKVMKLIEE